MTVTAAVASELKPFLDALALSPDAVFVTDRRNRIVLWNKAVEHLLGYSEREVVGYACGAILMGDDGFGNRYCSDPCPVVQIANRGESVRRFELELNSKSKTRMHVEVTILILPVPPPHHFLLSHIIRPVAPREEMIALIPPASAALAADPDARVRKLTAREREVLGMLAGGLSSVHIGDRLSISALTARNHVQNILEKLEVHSKAEAVAFAFRHHML